MAVAEFERSLIRERFNAGLRAAKGRGVRLGRPLTLAGRRQEFLSWKRIVRLHVPLLLILMGEERGRFWTRP